MVEDSLLGWISGLCVAAATIGCVYTLLAAVLVLRFGRTGTEVAGSHPPVTVLKPLCGREPGLFARLLSFDRQDYRGPVQIVFGAQDHADPAIDTVKAIQAIRPDAAVDLKIDTRTYGSNRKVSNLINMASVARHDTLILSDSDIEVGPSYLANVVAELQKPRVGAVTCLYHGVADAGLWAQLSAMAINTYFLPNAVLANNFGLAQPCFGATIAMRRETLNRIGGFQAFADCLADDYAIGEAVRAVGDDVSIPAFSVGHVCFERSAIELLRHQIRQSRTIRSIDPIGYAGALMTHPFAFAVIAALLGGGLLVAAAAVICRILLCVAVEHAFGLPRHSYWLIPVRDLMSFAVFVSAFFATTVSWRGSRYRVMSDGSVVQESNSRL